VVASNFDIFSKVGGAAGYDEVTRFSIRDGQMIVNEELSDFDGTLAVQFLKVSVVKAVSGVFRMRHVWQEHEKLATGGVRGRQIFTSLFESDLCGLFPCWHRTLCVIAVVEYFDMCV